MVRTAIAAIAIASPLAVSDTRGAVSALALPLHYDAGLAAKGFPSPLVRATVGTDHVWFLVDTGAGVHTIAEWLVRAAHLNATASSATTTGSTGATTQVRMTSDVSLRLDDGAGLTLDHAIVVALPQMFADLRIGGFLSPQLLAREADAAVLDLRVPSLTFESFDTASALGRTRTREDGGKVCHNADSALDNRLYAAPAIAAGTSGEMLIDTGSTDTVFPPTSSIGILLAGRPHQSGKAEGVGGGVTKALRVPGVKVDRAGTSVTVTATIGGTAGSCGPDGQLGMDALRDCVLVLGRSAFSWSCSPRGVARRPTTP